MRICIRLPLVAVLLVVATACAAPRTLGPEPAVRATDAGVRAPAFDFARDTFAFPNQIRSRHPGRDDLYANYCFVLARGLRQFFVAARFDPAAPRLDHAGYVERVRRVGAVPPWQAPRPAAERVVIPGYAGLREFSRAEEAAVKEGLGGRFWTLVHWTNWRVTVPVSGDHQEAVARQTLEELARGRLVQLLVTNWPRPELNHTVVVFEARPTAAAVELVVWDPNDPAGPGRITFDRERRRFWAAGLYDTEPGPIRAFRMYHSPLL